jgi:hypothetical protein
VRDRFCDGACRTGLRSRRGNGQIRSPPARRCATARRAFLALGQWHGSGREQPTPIRSRAMRSIVLVLLAQSAKCRGVRGSAPGSLRRVGYGVTTNETRRASAFRSFGFGEFGFVSNLRSRSGGVGLRASGLLTLLPPGSPSPFESLRLAAKSSRPRSPSPGRSGRSLRGPRGSGRSSMGPPCARPSGYRGCWPR